MEKSVHRISIDKRKEIEITGVVDVISYDEREISLKTSEGNVLIEGEGFNVKKLDVESGVMSVDGRVDSLVYETDRDTKDVSIFKRIFK